ncbi:MAG: hypothetical protein NZ992_02205 [Candidatus Korarchaeum sp.]|nr:hypothetical protein [Candidatus Korarchaeum sp.]MDW8036183.1 hypothetical protein [Candidatus Korarchaeum sp.]
MVSLKVVKAIKLTPSLLAKFLLIPFRRVSNPCLYCPGVCITSCPTFLKSGNMALSPLGYSKSPDLGRRECLKCWRCVSECPLGYELPAKFSGKVELELELVRSGSPVLLSVEGLDVAYGTAIAEKLNFGLYVVKGLLRRYDDGCEIESRSLSKVRSKVRKLGRVISLSPEASHSLAVPFFLEEACNFPVRLNYRGPVHIPCLLIERSEEVLRGMTSIGASPTEVIKDSCLKLDVPRALSLCPRASSFGLPCFYDLMEFSV